MINENNQGLTASEEKIKMNKLSILKTKSKTSLPPKEVLKDLLSMASERQTSSLVLVGVIIAAENITISNPAEENNLVTDQELFPETTRIIDSAVNNPNSNQMVAEVANSSVENMEQNAEPNALNMMLEELNKLRATIAARLQDFQSDTISQANGNDNYSNNAPTAMNASTPEYSVVEAQSKYGVINSYGIVKDSDGAYKTLQGTRDEDGSWKPQFSSRKINLNTNEFIKNLAASREKE